MSSMAIARIENLQRELRYGVDRCNKYINSTTDNTGVLTIITEIMMAVSQIKSDVERELAQK